MSLDNRKEIFKAINGSWNYNLNTQGSDKDYKIFVIPTFEDLYFNNHFSKTIIGQEEDLDYKDIREFPKLIYKANISWLEILYSIKIHTNLKLNVKTLNLLSILFSSKDELVKMNLPYLYESCIGTYKNKIKNLDKGTAGTAHLVALYQYDTKQALHAMRFLDFLKRYANSDFTDFKSAIYYGNDDPNRKWLLSIKDGLYKKEEFVDKAEQMLYLIESQYKEYYRSFKLNTSLNDDLTNLVKDIVKNEVEL